MPETPELETRPSAEKNECALVSFSSMPMTTATARYFGRALRHSVDRGAARVLGRVRILEDDAAGERVERVDRGRAAGDRGPSTWRATASKVSGEGASLSRAQSIATETLGLGGWIAASSAASAGVPTAARPRTAASTTEESRSFSAARRRSAAAGARSARARRRPASAPTDGDRRASAREQPVGRGIGDAAEHVRDLGAPGGCFAARRRARSLPRGTARPAARGGGASSATAPCRRTGPLAADVDVARDPAIGVGVGALLVRLSLALELRAASSGSRPTSRASA